MANIAVIIPIHIYNDDVKQLLTRAIDSVNDNAKIFISCPNTISGLISVDVPEYVEIFDEARGTNFQTLVNHAVNKLEGFEWFSILEYDDVYTPTWFNEVDKYITHYPSTSVFLPLTDLVKNEDGRYKLYGYGNEAPLASAFSNELEVIDFETLENYFDFYLTGGVFNLNDYIAVGGLKESMELTFWYEFLLRLTHKEKRVQVIPKIGYIHTIAREGSLFSIYQNSIDAEESEWWYELAKEEYRYTKDRNKKYNKEEGEEG